MAKAQAEQGKAQAKKGEPVLNAEKELRKLQAAKGPVVVTDEDLAKRQKKLRRVPARQSLNGDEAFEIAFNHHPSVAVAVLRQHNEAMEAVRSRLERQVKGGKETAAKQKKALRKRNDEILTAAEKLTKAGRRRRELAGLLAEQFGLSERQIRAILKAGLPVVPKPKRRRG